jgi:DNA-binding transcriptional LysR family regulator
MMHGMHLSAVDLNLLPLLHAVLETRSVKAAARRVGLSPSASSHALGRLRTLLDDPLLVRAGRQMQLTPRAERLRPRVQRLVDELGRVLQRDEAIAPARLRRPFTLGAGDLVELVLLAPLGRRLAAAAPGVDLYGARIEPDVTAQVREGRSDVVVGVFDDQPDDIRTVTLLRDRFVCLLRADHPVLSGRLTTRRYAALDHLLVAPRGVPRGVVDRLLEAQGLRRRVARTVSSFVVAPHVVAGSDLVLTVSELVARRFAAPLGLAVRPPPLPLPGYALRMAWHRRVDADPAHAWLRQQVIEVAAAARASVGKEPRRPVDPVQGVDE